MSDRSSDSLCCLFHRQQYVPKIRGKVLDIAVGTGNNVPFYPSGVHVTLVDLSPEMM